MVVGPPLGCGVCPRMRTPPSMMLPWEGVPTLWPDCSQQSELTSCCLRRTPLLSGDQRTKQEFAPLLSQDRHPFLLPVGVENSPDRTGVQSSGGDSSSPFLLLVGFYPLSSVLSVPLVLSFLIPTDCWCSEQSTKVQVSFSQQHYLLGHGDRNSDHRSDSAFTLLLHGEPGPASGLCFENPWHLSSPYTLNAHLCFHCWCFAFAFSSRIYMCWDYLGLGSDVDCLI